MAVLQYLEMAMREHCRQLSHNWLTAFSHLHVNFDGRDDLMRERYFLSGRIITDERSPYKDCAEGRYLHEDGEDIVVRKVVTTSTGDWSQDGYRLLHSMSDDIQSQRRTITRSAIGTIVKEMVSCKWWCDNPPDDDNGISLLVDKIVQRYEALKAAKAKLHFVWRDDIVDAYDSWHPLSCSCMTGKERSCNVEIYERTIGGKRFWALEAWEGPEEGARFMGRCLVFKPSMKETISEILADSIDADDVPWRENAEGWRVQRIYGNSPVQAGSDEIGIRHVKGAMIKQLPWLIHETLGFVAARIPSSTRLPYLDNHGYFVVNSEEPGAKIIIGAGGEKPRGGWRHESGADYEGGFIYNDRNRSSCSSCGESYDDDDLTCVNDELICNCCLENNYVWCRLSDEYVHNEQAIRIVSGPYEGEYCDQECLPVRRGNVHYVLARDEDGSCVAAPQDECQMCMICGEEDWVFADDGAVVDAKVIDFGITTTGAISSRLVVTDETVRALKSDVGQGRLFKGSDGEYYYYNGRRLDVGRSAQLVASSEDDKAVITFFIDGRVVEFVPEIGAKRLVPVLSERDGTYRRLDHDDYVSRRTIVTVQESGSGFNVCLQSIFVKSNSLESLANCCHSVSGTAYQFNDRMMGQLNISLFPHHPDYCIRRCIEMMHTSRRFSDGTYVLQAMDGHRYSITANDSKIFATVNQTVVLNIDSSSVEAA